MDLTNGAINISPIAVRVGLYEWCHNYIPCSTGISCQWYTVSKDYGVRVGLYEWYHICPVALEYVVPGVLFLRSKVSPDIILCC